uniref:ERAP1-like C-terminal domain-containing protein n=1 Tax=Megaselia scalaris TaxID=36166 RepID=T1GD19_MEGSC
MSSGDRASLIDDAFALADAAQLNYGIAFDLTRYLVEETAYVPWEVASSKLLSLKNKLYYTPVVYERYITYARELIDNAYILVKSWEIGTDFTENFLTATIMNAACSLGHTGCLEVASQKFNDFIANPSIRGSPDLRETIYYYGMATSGTEKSWNIMWEIYKNEVDAQEKIKLMKGLSGISEPWILQKFIDLAWDESNVRGQDYVACLSNIANNPNGRPLVWDHVRNNWDILLSRFGLNSRVLGRLIPSITSSFSTQIKMEEMDAFFDNFCS